MQLDRSLSLIDERLSEVPSLAGLADASRASVYHFSRQFKAVVGEAPIAYAKRLRLERAAFQLAYTRSAIKRIGFEAGFHAVEAFSRAFTKQFGRAPGAYRTGGVPAIARGSRGTVGRRAFPFELRREPARIIVYARRRGSDAAARAAAWVDLARHENTAVMATAREWIGIYADYSGITAPERGRHDAGAVIAASDSPRALADIRDAALDAGIAARVIPGGDYAVVRYQGRREAEADLDALWHELYFGWQPPRDWQIRADGAFERFSDAYGRLGRGDGWVDFFVPLERGH